MNMSIKSKLKIGSLPKSFRLYLIFIILYFISNLIFYVFDEYISKSLHSDYRPITLYIIKYIYASFIFVGIIRFKNNPSIYWPIINSCSVGLLLLWFVVNYKFAYFTPPFDQFLLEFVAIGLIFSLHAKFLKQYYSYSIKPIYYIFLFIPVIISTTLYLF